MKGLRALALIALTALTGCGWTGPDFYSQAETVAPIVAGDYRMVGATDRRVIVRVAILPNGLTRFGPVPGGRHESLAGFAPLDPEHHLFTLWVTVLDGQQSPADGQLYGVAEARPDGHVRFFLPNCDGDRALAVGATVTGTTPPECRFHDRAELEAALRAFSRHPGEAMELIPIPHG